MLANFDSSRKRKCGVCVSDRLERWRKRRGRESSSRSTALTIPSFHSMDRPIKEGWRQEATLGVPMGKDVSLWAMRPCYAVASIMVPLGKEKFIVGLRRYGREE
eukprot:scaffold268_cov210-Ochromonas_danica.AAC.38